jgi:hypothetical protein
MKCEAGKKGDERRQGDKDCKICKICKQKTTIDVIFILPGDWPAKYLSLQK